MFFACSLNAMLEPGAERSFKENTACRSNCAMWLCGLARGCAVGTRVRVFPSPAAVTVPVFLAEPAPTFLLILRWSLEPRLCLNSLVPPLKSQPCLKMPLRNPRYYRHGRRIHRRLPLRSQVQAYNRHRAAFFRALAQHRRRLRTGNLRFLHHVSRR